MKTYIFDVNRGESAANVATYLLPQNAVESVLISSYTNGAPPTSHCVG
eukprot:CAMPEP_0202724996 /NCGR_PEP_ID=MMETSP1385-20130828/178466_1 /ASSEMBLY_ACC=CAM_ASM_000861 /TAXON_ID=933848 /ORGANISM="Elphidium margaritaceum" /LENGTH=47 /DNA_ID=CAMNT_0049390851 /DNA_START=89 /DNA_END=228 /DNA_ORIENTATION=+